MKIVQFKITILLATQATENVYLRINRVVRGLDELTALGSLIGRDTSPSSSAVGGAVSFSLSSSSLLSPLAIPQSLLSSSVVKMMSVPSRVLGLECPWGNSHYRHHRRCMLVNHLSGLAILAILLAAQNFHHSLLFVHPPEELLARKVRPLFYSNCVLLPMVCTRTAVVRNATLAFTTSQAVVTSYGLIT